MTIWGDDSRSDVRPIYCYSIRQIDTDIGGLFLTSYDGEVEISGMPEHYDAASLQVFQPANIAHGAIRREGNFDKTSFEMRAKTTDLTGLSRYALTSALPRIQVDVIKCNPGPVESGDVCQWGRDTMIVQTGLIASLGFQGFLIVCECVPEPLFSGQEIPRWRFSRVCNHQLFSPQCGVNQADFTLLANIDELTPRRRIIRLDDTFPGADDNFFRQGVAVHAATGIRLSVFRSWKESGKTYLKLATWLPDLEIGDVVRARAGCRHTFKQCKEKFDNAKNFGGFSGIPNKNPSQHGVK